jgi:GNAT superfamily N-acetyltransferase
LDAIHRLGRRHSRTVGFLPRGAFVDYLWRRGVLIAIDDDVVGYVMFATSRERVRIAQLVVSRDARGSGLARDLINAVARDRWHCYSMGLLCRQDFAAASLWPRLGFDAISTRRGRAGILVRWWRRLGGAGVSEHDAPGVIAPVVWSGRSEPC